jgi:LuxR family maltose regulon positive regulatory protein
MQGIQNDSQAARRPRLELVWSGVARTKFCVPRLPSTLVDRRGLVARARRYAMDQRLTLICGPAGGGKSTLLAQLAQGCPDAGVVWLSLDEGDSDAIGLAASLGAVLREAGLNCETEPQALASHAFDAGSRSRAAVALLVNALCTFKGTRLLLVLDDLHRVGDGDSVQLLDHLIERLPPWVGVVVGTRVMPELSLARWRLRGELGEISARDLLFDMEEATALATLRLGAAASADLIRQAWKRTSGWVAGLQLVLATAARGGPVCAASISYRHMFDFLAREVLTGLPEELVELALESSVLSELTPSQCAALSREGDVRKLLQELCRQNLFVEVVDESGPTLRFHGFFREFLRSELERRRNHGSLRGLSPRELEVLTRISAGDSNKVIARTLDLSLHTVKRHVANILAKLDAPTRKEAAALWFAHRSSV